MSPRRRMSEQAAEAAVDQACRVLRLPTIRNQFPDLAAKAGNDQMSYLVFLAELLLAECDDRARRRSVGVRVPQVARVQRTTTPGTRSSAASAASTGIGSWATKYDELGFRYEATVLVAAINEWL
jgi:hypothetical protein